MNIHSRGGVPYSFKNQDQKQILPMWLSPLAAGTGKGSVKIPSHSYLSKTERI